MKIVFKKIEEIMKEVEKNRRKICWRKKNGRKKLMKKRSMKKIEELRWSLISRCQNSIQK
jgi:hypothetical protein